MKSTCGSTPVLVSSSLFPTFSLARSINDASTLMSLLSMVPQSKQPSSAPTRRHSKKTQDLLLDFAPLSLSIGIETAGLGGVMRNTTIPIKNPKFPSLTLTTNPVCLYRYNEGVLAPRTTISSASLSCLTSLLHPVVLKLTLCWYSLLTWWYYYEHLCFGHDDLD